MTPGGAAGSAAFDTNLRTVTHQALFDVAQALGMENVTPAALH